MLGVDLTGARRASLGLLPLLAVACGAASGGASATPHESMMMTPGASMAMQPGAELMKAVITSPSNGSMVTTNTVTVTVSTSGYKDTCATAGTADQQGKGHYHLLFDHSLVNMFCSPQAVLSMQNVNPGMHMITAVPAQNDHTEIEANAKSITVDYEPTSPLAAIGAATLPGAASIRILSPSEGQVVSGNFDVTVQVTNFNLSCDLMGKPDVAGYGHWHLNYDTTTGAMMGMTTMAAMSCVTVIHATTTGLSTGSRHALIAILVDNVHAPLHPEISSRVDVTVG